MEGVIAASATAGGAQSATSCARVTRGLGPCVAYIADEDLHVIWTWWRDSCLSCKCFQCLSRQRSVVSRHLADIEVLQDRSRARLPSLLRAVLQDSEGQPISLPRHAGVNGRPAPPQKLVIAFFLSGLIFADFEDKVSSKSISCGLSRHQEMPGNDSENLANALSTAPTAKSTACDQGPGVCVSVLFGAPAHPGQGLTVARNRKETRCVLDVGCCRDRSDRRPTLFVVSKLRSNVKLRRSSSAQNRAKRKPVTTLRLGVYSDLSYRQASEGISSTTPSFTAWLGALSSEVEELVVFGRIGKSRAEQPILWSVQAGFASFL